VSGYRRPNPPADVRKQIGRLTQGLEAALRQALVGIYLHGSLALGCFNRDLSDIDLLVVTRRRTTEDEQRQAVALLLASSGEPSSVELSVLAEEDLEPWRYPTPYDFHYAEPLRAFFEAGGVESGGDDYDLPAHITVSRAYGIALAGPPPHAVFPEVPWPDYADSLRRDLEWAIEADPLRAIYKTLSPARIWATLSTGEIHSKESGAVWALERLPPELRPLVERALARYRGEGGYVELDEDEYRRFAALVRGAVASVTPIR
jgi:predicted nucleotidyltransferase